MKLNNDSICSNKIKSMTYYQLKPLMNEILEEVDNGIYLSDEFLDLYNLVKKELDYLETKRNKHGHSLSERFYKQLLE